MILYKFTKEGGEVNYVEENSIFLGIGHFGSDRMQ